MENNLTDKKITENDKSQVVSPEVTPELAPKPDVAVAGAGVDPVQDGKDHTADREAVNMFSGQTATDDWDTDEVRNEVVDPSRNISRLLDVEMNVTVRFGKTLLPLREVVNFGVGSMIELNRNVDEPVELLVNDFSFARGEVVVIDGYYGVKITEIGTPEERSLTLFSGAKSNYREEK